MATYYVLPGGAGTQDGLSWANAMALPSTALTAGGLIVGPHTLYIAPGDYADRITENVRWTNGFIIGTNAIGTIENAAKDQVVIHTLAATVVEAIWPGITISNISAYGGVVYVVRINDINATFNNCHFYNPVQTGVRLTTYTGLVMNNCLIEGAIFYSYHQDGAATAILNNCIIQNDPLSAAGGHVAYATGTGSLTLNGCLITGGSTNTIHWDSTGTLTIRNSIIGTPYLVDASYYCLERTAGTVDLLNNMLVSHWSKAVATTGVINTDTNNLRLMTPRWTRHTASGYILFEFDNADRLFGGAGYAYMIALTNIFKKYGVRGVLGIEAMYADTYLAVIKEMIASGVWDVCTQGYHHCAMGLTGAVFTITRAASTVDVNRAADTITVSGGGVVNGFKAKTLDAIRIELNAMAGTTAGAITANISQYTFGEILADSAGAQASPYTTQLLIDVTCATGYFLEEIAKAKTKMQANFGGTQLMYSLPYGSTSANLMTALANAGFQTVNAVISTTNLLISSIDLFNIPYREAILATNYFIEVLDVDTQWNIRSMCEWMAQHGGIMIMVADNYTDATLVQWDYIINIITTEYPELTPITQLELNAYVRGTPAVWTPTGANTFTTTQVRKSNYHLLSTSPCIDAGMVAGLTTDYEGTSRPQGVAYDIGPYEFSLGGMARRMLEMFTAGRRYFQAGFRSRQRRR